MFFTGTIGSEVDMAIDEAGKNNAVLQVDQGGASRRVRETFLDGKDLSFRNQDAGVPPRFFARAIEKRAGVNDRVGLRGRGRRRRSLSDERGS